MALLLTFNVVYEPPDTFDWPTPERIPFMQGWINVPSPGFLKAPFSQSDWPLPKAPERSSQLLTWTWSYNINLIGKDKLPTGEQVTDLPPRAYPEPATRTWGWNYNLNLIGKDRLPTGEQVSDLPPRAYPEPATRTWVWSYNLNLVGKDQLPTGEQIYTLPPVGPEYPTSLRTWTGLPVPAVAANPFYQLDWPINLGPIQPLRSWTWSYNLNLVGQDKLPVGEQISDLPPRAYEYSVALRSWIVNLLQSTLYPLPYGVQIYDLPPSGPLQPLRSWTWSYNLNLIGKDQLPTGE